MRYASQDVASAAVGEQGCVFAEDLRGLQTGTCPGLQQRGLEPLYDRQPSGKPVFDVTQVAAGAAAPLLSGLRKVAAHVLLRCPDPASAQLVFDRALTGGGAAL